MVWMLLLKKKTLMQKSLNIFDACEIFEDNLKEITESLSENLLDDIREHKKDKEQLGTSWVADEVRALAFDHAFKERIQRIRMIRTYQESKEHPERYINRLSPADIDRARHVPIHTINPNKMKKIGGGKYLGLCPFHNDRKNPAFYVFKDNHYKCFTCNVYGDAIDFYQRTHNVPFIQAVNALI